MDLKKTSWSFCTALPVRNSMSVGSCCWGVSAAFAVVVLIRTCSRCALCRSCVSVAIDCRFLNLFNSNHISRCSGVSDVLDCWSISRFDFKHTSRCLGVRLLFRFTSAVCYFFQLQIFSVAFLITILIITTKFHENINFFTIYKVFNIF